MNESSVKVGWKISREIKEEIDRFAEKKNMLVGKAAENLIRSGLIVENSNIYDLPLANMVRSLIRGELGLFKEISSEATTEVLNTVALLFEDMVKNQESILIALSLVVPMSDLSVEEKILLLKKAGSYAAEGFSYEVSLESAALNLAAAQVEREYL